jgi:hypothetical protein
MRQVSDGLSHDSYKAAIHFSLTSMHCNAKNQHRIPANWRRYPQAHYSFPLTSNNKILNKTKSLTHLTVGSLVF